MALDNQGLLEIVKEWISRNHHTRFASEHDFFDHMNFDSLDFARLIAFLESQLAQEIDFSAIDDWASIRTPEGLVAFILGKDESL